MSALLSKVLNDDFVWAAVTGNLRGRSRRSNTGFINVNCPMCHLRGHNHDTKTRLGIKKNHDGVGFFCFRCGFATAFKTGGLLSKDLKNLFLALGLSQREVQFLNHKALQYKRFLSSAPDDLEIIPKVFVKPSFKTTALPEGARNIYDWIDEGCDDPNFLKVLVYLHSRGDALMQTGDFFWSPSTDEEMQHRFIIPFRYDKRIVGWTARVAGEVPDVPKYRSRVQTNFMFNAEAMYSDREFVTVSEGVLDGKVLDGISTLGAKMTDDQISWLKESGKKIIVVPDRDLAGERLINIGRDNGWMVAFPTLKEGHGINNWWAPDCKDVTDASARYGRLYTLRSVLETATDNKAKIEIVRRLLY